MKTVILISNGRLQYAGTTLSDGQLIVVEEGKKSTLAFDSVDLNQRAINGITKQWIDDAKRDEKNPTSKQVQMAKDILKAAGYIGGAYWHEDDVISQAETDEVVLTPKQVKQVCESIERCHDANEGINWDVISCHIDMVTSAKTSK